MLETVEARSGNSTLTVQLDAASGEWKSATHPDEGTFPWVAEADGKRYEIYSDGTFAEVETGADD